jgi:hypothetical protein
MAKVFISYRRGDSKWASKAIYDHLCEHFGNSNVFMDIDTIKPGVDFVQAIEEAVNDCNVLLALIGQKWLNIEDKHGKRRLDNPNDFVRLEVATALKKEFGLIPVLVDDAPMPLENELPDDLSALPRRNAIDFSEKYFNYAIKALLDAIHGLPGISAIPPEFINEYMSNITPRLQMSSFTISENVEIGDYQCRYVAEGQMWMPIWGASPTLFLFAKFDTLTLDEYSKYWTTAALVIKNNVAAPYVLYPVAIVNKLDTYTGLMIRKQNVMSGLPKEAGGYFFPVMYDLATETHYYPKNTPIGGAIPFRIMKKKAEEIFIAR